jgi:DNA-binding response OmpR family regulator
MTAKSLDMIGSPANMPLPSRTNLPPRILVVDDEPDIRRLNTEVLAESSYQVDAAEDGAVAWQALNTNSYDLLITDNDMPKVSGIELLGKLNAARIPLPVIMVSGTMPTEDFKQHPWLQIHIMLLKPYTITELLAKVKEALCTAAGVRERITSSPNRQSQTSVDRLQA